jgi:serine/threonine protein kinase
MELLGLSLKDILKRGKKHFSTKCVMTIGVQMLDRLEKFHDEGFIHCDIKPDNILIGNYTNDNKAMNVLYLIDYGISQKYLSDSGKHHEMKHRVAFKGNVIFSSKNAFAGKTLSRRDDIISLAYFLIFCINSK